MYESIKIISKFLFENGFSHFEIKTWKDNFNISLLVKDSNFQKRIVLYPITDEKHSEYIGNQLNAYLKYLKG